MKHICVKLVYSSLWHERQRKRSDESPHSVLQQSAGVKVTAVLLLVVTRSLRMTLDYEINQREA